MRTYLLVLDRVVLFGEAVRDANHVCWFKDTTLMDAGFAIDRGVIAALVIAEAAINRVQEKVKVIFGKFSVVLGLEVDDLLRPNNWVRHLVVQSGFFTRLVQRGVATPWPIILAIGWVPLGI